MKIPWKVKRQWMRDLKMYRGWLKYAVVRDSGYMAVMAGLRLLERKMQDFLKENE